MFFVSQTLYLFIILILSNKTEYSLSIQICHLIIVEKIFLLTIQIFCVINGYKLMLIK